MKITREYTASALVQKSEMLPELKKHLRILVNDFDASLTTLLSAAIEHAENHTGCIFLSSIFTIKIKGSKLSKGGFYPAQDVSSATFNQASITEDVTLDGGRVIYSAPAEGIIEVTFTAGYPTVPDAAKAAIYLIASSLFNNPTDGVHALPTASTNLLKSYRRWQT